MYQWRNKLKHSPTSMHELWRHYVECQFGSSLDVKRLWFNRRDVAASTFLDFMQLQRLDMESAFWCQHMQVTKLSSTVTVVRFWRAGRHWAYAFILCKVHL